MKVVWMHDHQIFTQWKQQTYLWNVQWNFNKKENPMYKDGKLLLTWIDRKNTVFNILYFHKIFIHKNTVSCMKNCKILPLENYPQFMNKLSSDYV